MPKAPFERVFSLIERKKILQRVAREKAKVLLKTSSNQISEFQAEDFEGTANLIGHLTSGSLRDFEKVTALFYVGTDRYFLTTRIKKKDDYYVLLNDAQFFKFNRRTAFRVNVPLSLEMSFHVHSIRNIEVNKKVGLIEFSSGGARIYWPGDRKLSKGALIRGTIQWGSGKVLQVDALVVHSPTNGIYGIRFINLSVLTTNRLKLLSIEVQQAIHFN